MTGRPHHLAAASEKKKQHRTQQELGRLTPHPHDATNKNHYEQSKHSNYRKEVDIWVHDVSSFVASFSYDVNTKLTPFNEASWGHKSNTVDFIKLINKVLRKKNTGM